jgi:hypothetical protein
MGTSSNDIPTINSIKLYPNPVENELCISNFESQDVNEVQIFDIYGKEISNIPIIKASNEITINASHLLSGIYFVKMGKQTGKFIKK